MKILLFASLSEFTGRSELEISGVKNTSSLKSLLEQSFPGISEIQYAIAVNKVIQHADMPLNESDEIALLPPFSGG